MALQFTIDISDADIPFFMDAVKRAEQRAVGKSAEEVIEAAEESPSPGELEGPTPRRTRRKATRDMGRDTGSAPDGADS